MTAVILLAVIAGLLLILLIFRKKLLLHFYFGLAVGRTAGWYRFLERIAAGFKKKEKKEKQQMKWLHRQRFQKTEIKSRDGVNLTGYYLKHPHAERIILMFHGWRGKWDKDGAAFAHGLYEKGCSILMVSQRAHDSSGGKYIGFGVLERYDCLEWIRFLLKRTDKIPVYLAGVSMGASTVLMAAGEELPERIKGVIADCGFTSPYEMVKIFAENFLHMGGKTLERAMNAVNGMCKKKAGFDLKGYSTLEAMRKCKIPVFFAHGSGDDFVPSEMTVENYKACRGRKTLYIAEGAPHTKSYISEPRRYMERVMEFFQWKPSCQM